MPVSSFTASKYVASVAKWPPGARRIAKLSNDSSRPKPEVVTDCFRGSYRRR